MDDVCVDNVIFAAPTLSVNKISDKASVNPDEVIDYTITTSNSAVAVATNVVVIDTLPKFTYFGLNTFGAGQPFNINVGASGLSDSAISYSNDGGVAFTYTPVSGAGTAPAGFDGLVTHFKIPMSGTMSVSSNFIIEYQLQVQ